VANRLATAGLLIQISLRNLLAGKARTFVVGGIILMGAVLVVVGSSLLDSIDAGMRGSIQGSLGGHIQLYEARSKDELALYGGMAGESLLRPIEDFSKVKAVVSKVPGVKQVVPMGVDQAMIATGNLFDVALEKLRADVRAVLAGDRGSARLEQLAAHKAHFRRMVTVLDGELEQAREVASEEGPNAADRAKERADRARAVSDGFWAAFDADPLPALEFLENRISPQTADGSWNFVRYVGTDLDAFFQAFDRVRVVEGQRVPSGQRGILLGKLYAEDFLKLRTARRMDRLRVAIHEQRRTIAGDDELQRWVRHNKQELRDILLQLDPIQAAEAGRRLRAALGSQEADLQKLLVELFSTDDRNFDARDRIFTEQLAPLLQLYFVKVGDSITIQAPGKSGYMRSVTVKVWGFVEFRGLERSAIAGIMSLLDLQSFRDLYGYLTAENAAEIQKLQQAAGLKPVSREEAEASLFGGGEPEKPAAGSQAGTAPGPEAVAATSNGAIDDAALLSGASRRRVAEAQRPATQEELDRGVALNAAVLLDDPSRIQETIPAIERACKAAGFDLKVVTWQQAAGMVGQFVTLARIVLFTAVFIIFAVALVIINNAMVMATLQRVKEIGTLRAIGAQARFVLAMLLVETVAVGLAFGLAGTALGVAIVWLIRATGGIAARTDALYFFFSGPALLPRLGAGSLGISLAIVAVVSLLSGLYPALLARRVTPLEAMNADD
jgi:ABC-type lipoprotein release transport system permease subunit